MMGWPSGGKEFGFSLYLSCMKYECMYEVLKLYLYGCSKLFVFFLVMHELVILFKHCHV